MTTTGAVEEPAELLGGRYALGDVLGVGGTAVVYRAHDVRTEALAGVTTFVHGRYSDDMAPGTNADTLAEIIQLARDTGGSAHVEHLISTGGTFTMDASLATIQAAIDEVGALPLDADGFRGAVLLTAGRNGSPRS